MIKFNMMAFLFDNELSPADLAKKLKKDRSVITLIRDRGTAKPSFIKLLRSKSFNPDPYISWVKK